MDVFERRIQYRFRDQELLDRALTHSSYGYENHCPHNERLEFLGDSILGYVISKKLFTRFPDKDEGTLSKLKSVLVSSRSLARKAKTLELGKMLRLGKGERKGGGQKKHSILADAMEALIGAITLDGGLEEAEAFIGFIYDDEVERATLAIKNAVDFKTRLQERLQELGLGLPNYHLYKEEGPPHGRVFHVRAEIGGYEGPPGSGTSKKSAQQESARLFLAEEGFWRQYEKGTESPP